MKTSNITQTSILDNLDTTIMPKQVQELIELLGVNEAYEFICQFGGQVKYIAKSPQRTSLKTVIKPENLAVLCAHFGGITLEVPKREHFDRQIRNLQIKQASVDGASRSELALKYNLSIRQIGNIKNK
ncbi:Mor transcription activator family protein [Vibrio sonorensis]|uniref:Mor transcription activator family protein n=1 Tax=Vibrio sonorensis TaxID=1004316 RepID=UPI0008D917DF|nr:Mor transcription activator family protein [Vibrio sonorensis]